ncbi:MAG TPA: phytanoyl-CoA dioxygenase family protein [Pyrinomonadaceae bacterium]
MTRLNWQAHLRTHGYAQFAGLTPAPLVMAALDAIKLDLGSNYDPARQLEYDNQSYCPDLRGTAPIMNLVACPPVRSILDAALGLDRIAWDNGQIAIRRAHNHPAPAPPWPHIDGFASAANGLDEGKIYSLTALLGIFLTPVERDFAGNFTVWPGSHHIYERYFRERGPRAMSEPMPTPEIGPPLQLKCGVGDVVLAHYELAHTAAVNTADRDRIAIYFRIWLRGIELDRWHYLTNIWAGWQL